MLNQTQIKKLISPYVDVLKDYKADGLDWFKKKEEDKYKAEKPLPPFSVHYLKTSELRERMLIHYDIHKFPYKLFRKKAPNETAEQWQYRKDNYQPVTMPLFHKAITVLNRVFNRSNVKIEYKEDIQRDYFTSIPRYGSIFNYFEQIVSPQKIVDPNAVIGVKPFSYPYKEVDGQIIIDQSEFLSPYPKIYSSEEVIEYIENEVLILWSKEKSLVSYSNTEKRIGNILEVWDKGNYWEVRQVGKYLDFEFEYRLIYTHGLGYLPAQKLKGQPLFDTLQVIYQSYFLPAIPNLDTALYLSSNLDISYVTQMFPQKWRYVSECTNPACNKGKIPIYGTDGDYHNIKYETCPTCKGTNQHQGVMEEYLITVPNNNPLNDNDNIASIANPPFGFVAPPYQVLESVGKRIDGLMQDAFANINIDITEKPNGQTATEKKIDQDELINFITRFSREIYDTMEFVYNAIGRIRWGSSYQEVTIIEPMSFDIRTEEDLVEELYAMNEKGMNPSVKANVIADYIGKRFTDDELIVQTIPLMQKTDRLLGLNSEQIMNDLANKRVEPYQKVIHDSFIALVIELINRNASFLEFDINKQADELIKLAQEWVVEPSNLLDDIVNGRDFNQEA